MHVIATAARDALCMAGLLVGWFQLIEIISTTMIAMLVLLAPWLVDVLVKGIILRMCIRHATAAIVAVAQVAALCVHSHSSIHTTCACVHRRHSQCVHVRGAAQCCIPPEPHVYMTPWPCPPTPNCVRDST